MKTSTTVVNKVECDRLYIL